MKKTITIVILSIIILVQYGFGKIREEVARSSFGASVIRGSMEVFGEIHAEKDNRRKDAMIKIAFDETSKPYKFSNGHTDLFYRIAESFLDIK